MRLSLLALVFLLPQDTPKEPAAPQLPSMKESWRVPGKEVVGFDFSPDGSLLAVGGPGFAGTLDVGAQKVEKRVAQRDLVDEIIFNPAGNLVVSRSKGPDAVLRGVKDLDPNKFAVESPITITWEVVQGWTGSCPAAFDASGRYLALVNGTRGFKVWSLEHFWEKKRRYVIEVNYDAIPADPTQLNWKNRRETPYILLGHGTAVRFEGLRLWLGMEGGYLVPIDPLLLKPLTEPALEDETPAVKKPEANQLRVKPAVTEPFDKVFAFRAHGGDITSIAFLGPDLLTAGFDGKVKIWRIQHVLDRKAPKKVGESPKNDPQPVKMLEGHYLAISKDGRTLAVAEKNGIRCYDAPTLTPLSWTPVDRKLGVPARVLFSPDGSILAATFCDCPVCVKVDAIYTIGRERPKSHHHGGTLILYDVDRRP
jgi:WD40 repeat protein